MTKFVVAERSFRRTRGTAERSRPCDPRPPEEI